MSRIFSLILLLVGLVAANSTEGCKNVNYSLELRKVFVLHSADSVIVEVLFPLSLLSSIGILFFYIKFRAVREQPGDILLALSIGSVFLLVSYFATAIYNNQYPVESSVPDNFQAFCLTTGYFYALSFCCTIVYNVIFCVYFIVQIKNTLKQYQRKWMVHVLCVTVLLLVAIVLYLADAVGVSLFGVCGLKVSPGSVFVQTGLIFVYLVVLVVSAVYFRRYVPRLSVEETTWKMFISYYYRYIIAISINNMLLCICDLVSAVNCLSDGPDPNLEVFITIANTLNLVNPIIIFTVVLMHPEVKRGFRKTLQKWFGKNRADSELGSERSDDEHTGRQMIEMQNKQLLQKIMQQKRSSLIYTILAAIFIEDEQQCSYSSLKQLSDWNYRDNIKLTFNNNMLVDYEDMKIAGMMTMNVEVTSYAPRVFKTLMRSDGVNNLQFHVNPQKNEQQIRKQVQSDGGKSGQFFFFTYDNRIILKTLELKELDVILERLKAFCDHYIECPDSLITKICGIYTIKDLESDQSYTVYAMRNLAGCDRKFISRVYDLKGSRFDRKVIKDYSDIDVGHLNKTMKDQDFQQLEKKVSVSPEEAQQIQKILREDCNFFRQQRLIDYSLIIIRLDIVALMRERGLSRDSFTRQLANPYSVLFHTDLESAYVIGIIDYLETWTANKKGERFLKSLFFKTKTEQISAQSPEVYSERFVKELVQKIF